MAKRRLKDRAHTVNSSVSSSSPPSTNSGLTNELLDIIDRIGDNLGKAKSMLEIVQYDGARYCSVLTQLRYLSILQDLLNNTAVGFCELRDHCLKR